MYDGDNKKVKTTRRKFIKKIGISSALLGMGGFQISCAGNHPLFQQSSKALQLNANDIISSFDPFWANMKFHPTEYLSTEWGKELISLLEDSGAAQQYVRLYNQPEDAVVGEVDGIIQYNWNHFNERAELLLKHGMKPMVSFFAMPREIAAFPDVGRERPFLNGKFLNYSPPKDYKLWQELCSDFTRHVLQKFGEKEVSQWYLTGWNEPDLSSFWYKEDIQEYFKLYDHFAAGVKSVSEVVRIGGPALSSTKTYKNPELFRAFLKHITSGENTATGNIGSPIDFFAIHTYGGSGAAGSIKYDHPSVDYIIEQQMQLANIRNEFPALAKTPFFVAEWGVSSGGSKSMEEEPMAEVRNTQYAPAFLAALVIKLMALKNSKEDPIIEGIMLCLSGYEKEGTRDFEGRRTLHTLNGFHKPLLNGYKLLAKLGEDLIFAGTDPENPEISLLTSMKGKERLSVLVTNYQASSIENDGQMANVHLEILSPWPQGAEIEVKHWRIDETHSNGYTAFQKLGSPIKPSAYQRQKIEDRMKLAMLKDPEQLKMDKKFNLEFSLPCNGISLIEISKLS